MSDLEEVSDSELSEKMTGEPIKLLKKKYEGDSEEEEQYKSEEEEDDDTKELESIKVKNIKNTETSKGKAEGSESEAEESEAEGSDAEGSDAEASDAEASDAEGDAEGDADEVEGDAEEEGGIVKSKTDVTKQSSTPSFFASTDGEEEDDDEDDEDEDYLQKFDKDLRDDFITNFHPESKNHNYEEIKALARVSRNSNGIVSDVLHKTLPFLTKYEMTRILGQRARQINTGAKTFVVVPPNIMDGYFIAQLELEQKKIPFIIKRPIPNGGFEYWNLSDLELI